MRGIRLLFVAGVIALIIGSCATMSDYEIQRQVRLGLRAPPTPTPSPVPSPIYIKPSPTPSFDDVPSTPPQPLDKGSGALFQPWTSPTPHDLMGEKIKQSAEEAKALVDATRPEISKESAPGPGIPILKTLLRTNEDLAVVSQVFQTYAEAVHAVRVSVDAFGLKPNLEGLRRTREAQEYWALWFSRAHIYPTGIKPSVEDIRGFYAALDASGKAAADDIAAINALLDHQRSRVLK